MYRQRTDGKSVALKMVEHNVVRAWSRNPRENNTPTPSRGDLCVQDPRMINKTFENAEFHVKNRYANLLLRAYQPHEMISS